MIEIRDRTAWSLLYAAEIAAGLAPNHAFCEHGVCQHCGADAEEWDVPCRRGGPGPRHLACDECLPPFALSLKQPWAWAMLHLGKDVENRRWPTKFRGPVVIHASLTWDHEGEEFLREMCAQIPEDMPRGAFVGTMRITGCRRYRPDLVESLWAFGPWCFDVADAKPLHAPIPAKGRLGFYRWVPEPAREEPTLPFE